MGTDKIINIRTFPPEFSLVGKRNLADGSLPMDYAASSLAGFFTGWRPFSTVETMG